jgi:hypothetical protein
MRGLLVLRLRRSHMVANATGVVETCDSKKGYYCLYLVEPIGCPAGLVLKQTICAAEGCLCIIANGSPFLQRSFNVLTKGDATNIQYSPSERRGKPL